MSAHFATCPVLIGRDRERARLTELARDRRTTLISGQAGVGKSRLGSEAAQVAVELGMARLVGHCSPGPSRPFAPFVSAMRRRTRTLGADALAQLFEGPAFLAAALLPEAGRIVGLANDMPAAEDLYAAVWHVLNRLSAPTGSLLLLEDLHWADTDSLKLFSYLAQETADLHVWMVATYRSDELHRRHPLTLALAELQRERRYEEVGLAPLDRDEVRQMVSAIFDGAEVGDEFVDALLNRTEGNPFFIEEIVKVLVERGDIYPEGDSWTRRDLAHIEMPVTVRETLLSRARALDHGALEILQLAALAGERLNIPLLVLAAGANPERVEDVIREGLRLQLLVERRGASGTTYAFRHALTREALVDEVVGPDGQRLHARLGQAMVEIHHADLDSVAAELAEHFAQAGELHWAADFATRAARRAVAAYALEESGRRYDQALRWWGRDYGQRLDLLLEAAEALAEAPDQRLTTAFATEARELAHSAGTRLSEARALRVLARGAWSSGQTQVALGMVREAAELTHGLDDWQEGHVLAHLARVLELADLHSEAAALLPGAIELATRTGNYGALSELHGTRMLLTFHGPEFEEALEAALTAARQGSDQRSERRLTINMGYTRLWCGEFTLARQAFLQAVAMLERASPHDRYAHAGYAWLLSLLGEYDDTLLITGQLRSSVAIPTRIVALTAQYEVRERRGDAGTGALVDELMEAAARTGESQRFIPALAAKARHTLVQDGINAAAPIFWEVLTAMTSLGNAGSHWAFSPDFARALADEARLEELERWVRDVHADTERDLQPHNLAADTLCRAHLAVAQSDLESGRALCHEAIARYGAMPCPARHSEALLLLADLEERAGQAEVSAATCRLALEMAEGIGARAVAERAERALERVEVPSVLATVMFTDIVGSTEHVSALGDRAWRALIERHNALVRAEIGRWNGREVDSAGDGFLASFPTPAQGIRCALAVRDRLAGTGIQIRAGLHTGECQASGNKLVGITVHIAARVSAAAAPGEVLVSGTVRDLVAGSAFQFADRGAHHLKGVPGNWPLLAVSR